MTKPIEPMIGSKIKIYSESRLQAFVEEIRKYKDKTRYFVRLVPARKQDRYWNIELKCWSYKQIVLDRDQFRIVRLKP